REIRKQRDGRVEIRQRAVANSERFIRDAPAVQQEATLFISEQAALKRFVEQAYCHSEIATILCNEAGLSEIERIALRETGRDQ
ncbi:hypothetical protein ABTD32_19845, partial [Acinetobacter baumannii]